MKKIYVAFFVLSAIIIQAQTKSILQEQSEHYSKFSYTNDADWDALRTQENGIVANPIAKINSSNEVQACNLNKRVFGWHPYWVGTAYNNYEWNLLSDLCYFSYDASATTGNNTNSSFNWSTSTAVTTAINNGTDVHFCVTLFSNHSTFFASASAKQTLITNIINLLNARGGKGVNIDFEGMGASHKTPFTAFMQDLSTQLHAANPNYELSFCLYAVDWSAVFDIAALDPYVDMYTIMGYDYYYSGSSTAGPESPLYNFQTSYNYTISKSITYYLNKGATPSKVLLGLPWYGREWETGGSTAPSSTTGGFTSSRTFSYVKNNSGTYSAANKHWDSNSFNPYFSYQSGGNWRQCWIDDAYSMRKKFDMVNQRGIGGIGIWALGYDDGYMDYWNAIQDKFTDCATVPCSDTIYDMGGPGRNYYDSEKYTYTIKPTGASNVSLTFSQFDVELNYDTLWLYNGLTTSSPLIGAYTGTNSPGSVTSTNGGITLKFKSDNGTVNPGFTAIYNCITTSPDIVAPTTQVSVPATWITQNFNANFTDADEVSGIEKSFYQVLDYNGTEWRANNSKGFFSDNFDSVIHPDWTSFAGTWAINNGYLKQADESNSNTNIWANCNQTLSNRYLYNWQGKIEGTGSNRRAGFHFFCDNAATANRNNSYFVWFRLDQSVIETYKVTNDVFSLVNSSPYTFTANTFYDFTVSFDRISGNVQIWINNVLSSSWQDTAPHTAGNHISFRSGNCIYTVNNLKVYRSRNSNAATLVTVGSASTNDIRYQNPDPSIPSGRIKSINKDVANNLSAISSQDVNVDWTKPATVVTVNDGNSADIDTTYIGNQLKTNYTLSADPNSGIAGYFYSAGTTPGAQDIVPWTNNGTNLSVTEAGLSLINGQHYYFSVKAINAAGLMSDSTVSDGVIYLIPVGLNEMNLVHQISLYPNPVKDYLTLSIITDKEETMQYTLSDVNGKTIVTNVTSLNKGINKLSIELVDKNLTKGVYFLQITNNDIITTKKIIIE
ncbi:MAG TPA: glycosyl hydrolase family 18 protein [Bacteroidia bacterium]